MSLRYYAMSFVCQYFPSKKTRTCNLDWNFQLIITNRKFSLMLRSEFFLICIHFISDDVSSAHSLLLCQLSASQFLITMQFFDIYWLRNRKRRFKLMLFPHKSAGGSCDFRLGLDRFHVEKLLTLFRWFSRHWSHHWKSEVLSLERSLVVLQ